jgi:virginiamycin B lyase
VRVFLAGFIAVAAAGILPAQPRAKDSSKAVKLGIQTPGVQIPILKLKPEAEFSIESSPLAEPLKEVNKPCGNPLTGFGSTWVLNCSDGTLARIDAKSNKVSKVIKTGAANVRSGLAVSQDSLWAFTDTKTTLSRIDPAENKIVTEIRLPMGCNSMVYGETALWITCPEENRVLRVDPNLNVVSQRIEVSAQPYAVAVGEGSVWVYCRKDGKVERIDPKTNKVSKTIDVAVPNVEADIAVGEGSVWVSMPGFPITRIDPKSDKVMQQFVGDGGGLIRTAQGSLWLTNVKQNTVWRIDPKRVLATLAD